MIASASDFAGLSVDQIGRYNAGFSPSASSIAITTKDSAAVANGRSCCVHLLKGQLHLVMRKTRLNGLRPSQKLDGSSVVGLVD